MANPSYNQITFSFANLTQNQIVVESALLMQGQWVQGMQPIPQSQYANNSTVGPFATQSSVYGDGNGGELFLSIGSVVWSEAWNGTPTLNVTLSDPNTYMVQPDPVNWNPDPDNQHVNFVFQIVKR